MQYPCSTCKKPCKANQKSILCDICQIWANLCRTGLSNREFNELGHSPEPFFCPNCYKCIFPFQTLTNEEFIQEFFGQNKDSLSLKDLNDTIPECNDCYIILKSLKKLIQKTMTHFCCTLTYAV